MSHDDEGDDDREMPDEADMDDGDEPELVPCPYCGARISEDAEVCPECGNYLSREDAPHRVPAWVVVATCLVLAAMVVGWVMLRAMW